MNKIEFTTWHIPGTGTETGTLEECEAYKKLVIRKKKHLDKLQKEYADLLKSCPHPASSRVGKQRYFAGSYIDKAHTEYWNECSLCRHQSKIIIENHSWYE